MFLVSDSFPFFYLKQNSLYIALGQPFNLRDLCVKPTVVTLLQGIDPCISTYYSRLVC